MALTVEDGSVVTGADSWATRADFIAYALARGVVVADEDGTDVHLVKAAVFIGDHEANLKGYKVDRDQPLSFPRYGLVIEDWNWSSDEIARQVIICQMAYALDLHQSIDIYNPPQNPGLAKKSSRVEGAIKVEYATDGSTPQKLGRTSAGDALLASLLNNNGMMSIKLVRA